MHDQYLLRLELVIAGHRAHRLSATIHEGLRFEQEDVFAIITNFAFFGVKTFFETKTLQMLLSQSVNKPESGIMTRISVS